MLQKQFYTEITMLGAGIGYDYPLSERFMSEISTGMSFSVLALSENQLIAIVPKFFPYTKLRVKYFYPTYEPCHCDALSQKYNEIEENTGYFVGLQQKMLYREDGTFTINELHWGKQLKMDKNFLFSYQLGVGYFHKIADKKGMFAPTLGFFAKYTF